MVFIFIVVGLIFVFTFVNGFHDGCNVVATIIASRSMEPKRALFWASICEFLGTIALGTAVATTIGKGIIDPKVIEHGSLVSLFLIFSSVFSALAWNIITWILAVPSSSSHALIGGLVGGGIGAYGIHIINWNILFFKVILIMFITPIVGMVVGYLLTKISFKILADCHPKINNIIKRIQFISMCFLGASHGTNDAQKSMGLIVLVLASYGLLDHFYIPQWIVISCGIAISLGVLSGGWKLIKTIGFRIFNLEPIHSLNSQLAAGSVIYLSGLFGSPVSTSQIMSSSIMGVGAAHRFKQVRWQVAKEIFVAWFITIPVVGMAAILVYWILAYFFGIKQTSIYLLINKIKILFGMLYGTF
jgi:PiT family inorganic phosphate transporter